MMTFQELLVKVRSEHFWLLRPQHYENWRYCQRTSRVQFKYYRISEAAAAAVCQMHSTGTQHYEIWEYC